MGEKDIHTCQYQLGLNQKLKSYYFPTPVSQSSLKLTVALNTESKWLFSKCFIYLEFHLHRIQWPPLPLPPGSMNPQGVQLCLKESTKQTNKKTSISLWPTGCLFFLDFRSWFLYFQHFFCVCMCVCVSVCALTGSGAVIPLHVISLPSLPLLSLLNIYP